MSTIQAYTTATRPSAVGNTGLTIFNTTSKNINVSDGTNWRAYAYDTVYYAWTGNSSSILLDGVDDYLSSSFSPSTIGTGDYSVSFWFNIDTTATDDFPYFFAMGTSTTSGNTVQGCGLSNRSGTTYKVRINNNSSSTYSQTVSSGLDISAGTWYHFCFVRDGNTITLYKDGSSYLTLSNTEVGTNNLSEGSNFYLGWGANFGNRFVEGLLDEVAVFNSALTASEAGYIYNGQTNTGSGTATSGVPGDLYSFSPLHWWRMGDINNQSGNTIYDQGSGAKNLNLQPSGGPQYSTTVAS